MPVYRTNSPYIPSGGSGRKIYNFDPNLDANVARVSDGLSFATLASALEAADSGDIAEWLKLAEEMESKDPHLGAVADTRRTALTGIDWKINPGKVADERQKEVAMQAADYLREILYDSTTFSDLLVHLATAIGPNVAVSEIVWNGNRPEWFQSIPGNRLKIDYAKSPAVRVVTADSMAGVAATRGQFIVHIPDRRVPNPFANTISRRQAKWWLIKNLAIADWATFVEIFGMPIRWAEYDPNGKTSDIETLRSALASMGSLAYGLVPAGTKLEMREAGNRGNDPYKGLIEWIERKQAIGFLGQNMTTELTGDAGSRAAAQVHDNVRTDILHGDIRAERDTVRQQVFKPLLCAGFPFPDAPLPEFDREPRVSRDPLIDAQVLQAAQAIGLGIDRSWAYDRLGIQEPEHDEHGQPVEPGALLVAPVAAPPAFGGGGF